VEKARIRGVEVSTAIVVTDNLTADFGYTYLDTENLDTGMELGERPVHQVSMRLGYFWRRCGISAFLEGQYRGRRYADEDNEERLDEYAVFDIVLNKDFGDHYQGFVRVDNILNKKDVTDAYDVDGTEFLAGVQMNF
jgi:outer membrane cobalamin receptor